VSLHSAVQDHLRWWVWLLEHDSISPWDGVTDDREAQDCTHEGVDGESMGEVVGRDMEALGVTITSNTAFSRLNIHVHSVIKMRQCKAITPEDGYFFTR